MAAEWVAIDRRRASLDNRVATRAAIVHADDLTTARALAVRRLGVADAERHFVEVGVVADGESVSDAVVRVTRAAARKQEGQVPGVEVQHGGEARGVRS